MFLLSKLKALIGLNPQALAIKAGVVLAIVLLVWYQHTEVVRLKTELKLAQANVVIVTKEVEKQVEIDKKKVLSDIIDLTARRRDDLDSEQQELVDLYNTNQKVKTVIREKLVKIPFELKETTYNDTTAKLMDCLNSELVVPNAMELKKSCEK